MIQHSVDIEGHRRQKLEYSRTSSGQDYARMSLGFVAPVMCARPIAPLSEAGHRYILTLVGYATRYPEAVPLKKITMEAVAEALLDIYSRVCKPEEVLTDISTEELVYLRKY